MYFLIAAIILSNSYNQLNFLKTFAALGAITVSYHCTSFGYLHFYCEFCCFTYAARGMAQRILIIDFSCKARFSILLFYFSVLYCSIVGCVLLLFVFGLAKNCHNVSEFTRISCLSTPRFDAHIPPNATGGR